MRVVAALGGNAGSILPKADAAARNREPKGEAQMDIALLSMTAAVLTVHVRNGFFNSDNGYEFNLVLAAAVFALAGAGGGAWSLSETLEVDLAGTGWALIALGAGVLGGLGAIAGGRVASRKEESWRASERTA